MKVYIGDLVGGPDHGNSVEASVPRIRTEASTEMWLDGENKPSSVIVERGSYHWIHELQCFKWHAENIEFYSKRELQAA